MRINEVLNSKNYIVEDEQRGMRDAKIINDFLANAARVGSPGAKNPEVIAKARAIFVSQPDLSADEAFSIAKGQISKKNNRSDKPDRQFATARVKDAQDKPRADRKRGAQLGNQNARKNWSQGGPGTSLTRGISKVADILATGSLDNTSVADEFKDGSDIAKDIGKDLDAIAQVRKPKNTGNIFGS